MDKWNKLLASVFAVENVVQIPVSEQNFSGRPCKELSQTEVSEEVILELTDKSKK